MNSKIFVIGGWSGNRGLTRCDMYDPDVGKWSQIGDLHTGRYQTGVCMLNDVIYAVGGRGCPGRFFCRSNNLFITFQVATPGPV